jgi:hypothetical protein
MLATCGVRAAAGDDQAAAPAGQTGPGIRVTIYPILVKAAAGG